MKFASVLKLTAAAFVSGALLVPSIGPAMAAATYPPHVSILYASPVLTNGHAAVAVAGDHLTSGMSVKASRGTHSATAAVSSIMSRKCTPAARMASAWACAVLHGMASTCAPMSRSRRAMAPSSSFAPGGSRCRLGTCGFMSISTRT